MSRTTRVLCEGIYFGDDPRWHQGRLWFSDFFAHAVKSVSLAGDLRTEVEIDDQPSGLGWMPDGSLLIVSMFKRQVLRRSLDGKIRVHSDLSAIANYASNDMVVDSMGRAYVGDFGYDLPKAIAANGVESVLADHPTAKVAFVSPDGVARVAATDMHFPNGSVITPDGKTLIVAETLAERLTAFDIGADGSLTNRRVWAWVKPHLPLGSAELFARPIGAAFHRLPDGIALNAEGQIWMANAVAAECVLFAEGGKVLDVIDTGEPCFACMLGGDDGRTLFMHTSPTTATAASPKSRLIIANVDVPHAGLP
jgi:sugar lactone lactonase YvrE